MSRAAPARLALFLLLPLAAWPGLGYDGLRLPLALALAAALALGPLRPPAAPFAALAAFLVLQFLRLAPHAVAAFAAAAGLAAYAAARAADDRRAVPWVLSAVGAALGAAGAFGREGLEGNPNYAGAVAALLIPPLAALAAGEGGRLRAAALAGLAGAVFALLASESRGGLIAAVAGLAVAGGLEVRRRGRRALVLPALVALVLVAEPLLVRTARYASAERLDTAGVRVEIWKGSLRMALDRPLRGAGVGAFAREFPPYRGAREAAITQRDAGRAYKEVEDAHSTWLHVLAETGVPGLAAFLVALGFAARAAARGVRRPDAGPLEAGLAGLAAAFAVAATFNTLHDRVSPWVLFWAAVGLLEGPAPAGKVWAARLALLAAAPAAALAFWGPLLVADRAYHAGLAETVPSARRSLLQAAESGPYAWKAAYQVGVDALAEGDLETARRRFERVVAERPHHGGAWVNLAVARLRGGAARPDVEALLAKAKAADPTYFAVDYNLGNLALLDGRAAEARGRFRAAQSLHPRHAGSAYGEGAGWLLEGRIDDALPALRRARELGTDVAAALRGDFPALAADPRLAELFR